MELLALPAFTDNYIWMIHDGQQALVVDPGDSAPVARMLDAKGLSLAGILVTHHHQDHVGGLHDLLPRLAATAGRIFGPAREAIPEPYHPVTEGDSVDLMGCTWRVLEVPGHTAGHVAYFSEPPATAPILFCGDTLFSAGCGRLFEGTPAQMHRSLSRLGALPGPTRVCCAHEYTLANLRFAQALEPHNSAIQTHLQHCVALRNTGTPTLPSSIELELQINPFMRCFDAAVIRAARTQDPTCEAGATTLAALRHWKNTF